MGEKRGKERQRMREQGRGEVQRTFLLRNGLLSISTANKQIISNVSI